MGSASSGHGGLGTEADGRTACKAVQRLAPELLGGFFCSDPGGSGGSGGSERPSYPRLAIFSGNLLGHGARAQFPFVQGKGAQQGEPQRIGEFSFEIPRSSRDPPHFAERLMYDDGKLGPWTTTLCSTTGPEVGGLRPEHDWWAGQSRASFSIEGSGFHQRLLRGMSMCAEWKSKKTAGCRLAISYTIDETHYRI